MIYLEKSFLGSAKILVLVPAYNEETSIERCIRSILDQDTRDLKVVCQNNASTDRTLMILEELTKSDDRLHVLSTSTTLPTTENWMSLIEWALNNIDSEFVVFLSADDFWRDSFYLSELLTQKSTGNFDAAVPKFVYTSLSESENYTDFDIPRIQSNLTFLRFISFMTKWKACHVIYSLTDRLLFEKLFSSKNSYLTLNPGSDWWWAFYMMLSTPVKSVESAIYVRNSRVRPNVLPVDANQQGVSASHGSDRTLTQKKSWIVRVYRGAFNGYRLAFAQDPNRQIDNTQPFVFAARISFLLLGVRNLFYIWRYPSYFRIS